MVGASGGSCAYAETTSGRLVELKAGLGGTNLFSSEHLLEGAGRPDWLPTRVLLADTTKAMRRGVATRHLLRRSLLGQAVTYTFWATVTWACLELMATSSECSTSRIQAWKDVKRVLSKSLWPSGS